ncbi:RNA-binding protein 28-like [Dreissena polymorpha]|uniref:RRM domain-containing protein n=1 Tax=Dreissena polymorpha TaxID=45954 RepID=A0A9D4CRH4_DREPO|nr:RNA-binding protein 28-like [Dreissena polymorpha]KAH3730338.1 hypothetical protein DPMN_056321 [Dreissena polymorpha]
MSKESRTLFVRNLPYSITQDQLAIKFSDYGPIKDCFLVNNKETRKSRGFGYIKFTDLDDAKKAKEAKVLLEGRKVLIDFADITKKKKSEKKPRPAPVTKTEPVANDPGGKGSQEEEVEGDEGTDEEDKTETKEGIPGTKSPKMKNVKYHKAKIVVLSGLPAGMQLDELNKCLEKMSVKQLAESHLVSANVAHLKFKCIRDAKRAIRKLHNHPYKDCMLQAVQMSQERQAVTPQAGTRRSRVIVRNLSFKCGEDGLRKAFEQCGEITDISIPTGAEGKLLGFGFVQFNTMEEASKAVEQMNTQKIMGRSVAVDWALPKDKYESAKKQQDDSDNDSDEGAVSARSDSSSSELKKTKTNTHIKMGQSDDEGVSSDDNEGDEESDDGVEEEDDDKLKKEGDTDDEDDEDDEGGSNEDEDDATKNDKKAIKKQSFQGRTDTNDGCTLFIRNLSFDTMEEGMLEFFEKFGQLKYAKVVINQQTEFSKGMGFVRFVSKDSADHCLREGEAGNLTLDGRQLNITLAVSREKAADFQEKKEKEKKDNRNLYLAREGMIRPGTQAAEGLTKQDLEKRMKVDEVKRQKLKNINIFISPLRLCVRNIPPTVDEQSLRKIFKDAAGDPKALILECRIMRDRARLNSEGRGKSLGFAFISFGEHQHALSALRHTNNNPEIFGEKKRLIVEFSLENRKALEVQAKRKEKIQSKQQYQEAVKSAQQLPAKKPFGNSKKSPSLPLIQLSEKDKQMRPNKAPKGLPSHWGPKVRHKSRNPGGPQGKKAKDKGFKKGQQLKRPAQSHEQGPKQKKQRREVYDDFDKMVNKYKNSFMAKKSASSKWFE